MNLPQQIITLYEKAHLRKVPFAKVESFWEIGHLLFSTYWEQVYETETYKTTLKKLRTEQKALPTPAKLYQMTNFYLAFPDNKKLSTLLSWSHYQILVKVPKPAARDYYHQEAISEHWTVAALQQAITNHQFERTQPLVANQESAAVVHSKTYFQFSFLKKFAGRSLPERTLEDGLIEQLQAFLGELGKGFAFVGRQKRLITPNGKQLFVDLLFYNYLLNRFVLIDLKVVPLTYEHIGQMDTYCRLFDETSPLPDKTPCLGIILCPKIELSLLHYSLLKDHPSIFAFEYTLDHIDPQQHQQRTQNQNWEQALFQR